MLKRRLRICAVVTLAVVVFFGVSPYVVSAQTSDSENYRVTETQFNAGSTLEGCSGEYCAQSSLGDAASGRSQSGENTASFGAGTGSEPLLEVIVEPGESDLGVLDTESTAAKTALVKIRNYLSEGYTLQIIGDPPKYDGHVLSTPSSPTAAVPGTEQFGINIAANTTPLIGADPVQVPSDQTSFGVVEDDYKTPNLFKYESGGVVAHSSSESGQTDYTISMIVNIANSTPAGNYDSDLSAIVTPIY